MDPHRLERYITRGGGGESPATTILVGLMDCAGGELRQRLGEGMGVEGDNG
jgi:hypothetical protein